MLAEQSPKFCERRRPETLVNAEINGLCTVNLNSDADGVAEFFG